MEMKRRLVTIDRIEDKKFVIGARKSQELYLIKWAGYSREMKTWEPIENLQQFLPLLETFNYNWKLQKKVKLDPIEPKVEVEMEQHTKQDSSQEIQEITREQIPPQVTRQTLVKENLSLHQEIYQLKLLVQQKQDEIIQQQLQIQQLQNGQNSESVYNNHSLSQQEVKIHPCKVCEKQFSTRQSLLKHRRDNHEKKLKIFCQFCNKTCSGRDTLEKHIIDFHP